MFFIFKDLIKIFFFFVWDSGSRLNFWILVKNLTVNRQLTRTIRQWQLRLFNFVLVFVCYWIKESEVNVCNVNIAINNYLNPAADQKFNGGYTGKNVAIRHT